MAEYGGGYGGHRDGRQPRPELTHRITNLSEISSIDDFDQGPSNNPRSSYHQHYNTSSYQSYEHYPTSPRASVDLGSPQCPPTIAATSTTPSSWGPAARRGYEPVHPADHHESNPASLSSPWISSHSPSQSTWQRSHPLSPTEDESNVALLRSAGPMGSSPPPAARSGVRYQRTGSEAADLPLSVDISSMAGPSMEHQMASSKDWQEQDAKGHLTGGLGSGFKTDATLSGQRLLAAAATHRRGLSHSFSLSRSSKLSRTATLRNLGQDEADRRGQVIEVIMEDDDDDNRMPNHAASNVDLSVMAGTDAFPLVDQGDSMRQSTFPAKSVQSQVFYPRPNWKPFPMRWPYLLLLILLSLGLAIMQEVLYRISLREPLVRFNVPSDLSPGQYFAIKFAPVILAVGYGVLWQLADIEVKRLEAFYQLSKDGGALASRSINVDYVTSLMWLRPFRAAKRGHWAVFVSSIASALAISLVPTFSAASIVLSPSHEERLKNPSGEKLVQLHHVWSRLLTVTLCVCSILGGVLFYILQRRRSGLLADVRGIAGLASMAVVSHILVDFAELDVVSHRDIHAKLKNRRYVLRNGSLAPHYDESDGNEKAILSEPDDPYTSSDLSQNPHPFMLRSTGYIPFAVFLVLFLAFIPVFLFTPASVVTDHIPWLATALAVCIKIAWVSLDTDMRMIEPYYILSRRHAPPSILMLDYTAVPFGVMPIRALLNKHRLLFLVGFGSVMAEMLTVLVTGLSTVQGNDFIGLVTLRTGGEEGPSGGGDGDDVINAGPETELSFWLSLGLAAFILIYMLVVSTTVFVRRRHPFLPRQPNTIASVLAYIHQSKMIRNFEQTSKFDPPRMARRLDEFDGTYGLGWFEGLDRQSHCGVDQEELLEGYKHGYDFPGRNQPWDRRWDSYD